MISRNIPIQIVYPGDMVDTVNPMDANMFHPSDTLCFWRFFPAVPQTHGWWNSRWNPKFFHPAGSTYVQTIFGRIPIWKIRRNMFNEINWYMGYALNHPYIYIVLYQIVLYWMKLYYILHNEINYILYCHVKKYIT